ncbi:MAG: hypothetical protein K6T83_13705 [Alicyclobacillus sp.]|nr:hypothetical protein [Alicyclobacillus sp.]
MKKVQDICPSCVKESEEAFKKVSEYLKEHRGATLADILAAVDVDHDLLEEMIRSGRLMFADGQDVAVECKRCGQPVRSGDYCEACKAELLQGLSSERQIVQQHRLDEQQRRKTGYYSRDL